MITRKDFLKSAEKIICNDRQSQYGTPEDNFTTIGYLWSVYLRAAYPELQKVLPVNGISAKDVAVLMSLLKVARIATGSSVDSFVDLAGYAACAGEIATQEMGFRNENTCVCCGQSIPEGVQCCRSCSRGEEAHLFTKKETEKR